MVISATAPSLEVCLADFLDAWKARWRYEPRWPTEECATSGSPQFRVWLPLLHPARKSLGKAFYVQLRSRGGVGETSHRGLPLYRAYVDDTDPDGAPAILFCDAEGRVCLRAPWRAN